MKTRTTFWVLVLVMTLGASLAYAQGKGKVFINPNPSEGVPSAAEIQALEEFVNPLEPPDTSTAVLDTTKGPYRAGVMTKAGIIEEDEDLGARAYGSFGIPYTTTRVQDGTTTASGVTSANRLSTTYPYRAIGKLTFPQGYCSASLIRRSVIVTAAHCVHSYGGTTWYYPWTFRPGHYGASGATAAQIAPYGSWGWAAATVPSWWANGNDQGGGSARNNDVAVIVIAKNSSGQFIGDKTGYLDYGWNNYGFVTSSKTGNLNTAAVSTLGYPGLMDLGRIMQRTDGPSYTLTLNNAYQIRQGSNFTGGSSGGPWIVNFRYNTAALSGGAVAGTASTMAVVGVTSWGTSDPNLPKDNYSSQFRQNNQYPSSNYGGRGAGNIGFLVNLICSVKPTGSSLTFAQLGYCN